MQETEPTSTRSGLRFGKFSSTKLLCVFLTVVLDAAAIPVNDGSSNVMPDVTAIDPMPEPKNSGLLFASPDRHPTFAPRPTPPVPNLAQYHILGAVGNAQAGSQRRTGVSKSAMTVIDLY